MKFRPMLAGSVDLDRINFPVLVSPKLDGIRAIIKDGVVLSRSLKPIPNETAQSKFRHLEGLDGELIVGSPFEGSFQRTSSVVRRKDATDRITFYVFDKFDTVAGFDKRFERARGVAVGEDVLLLEHVEIKDLGELTAVESRWLKEGYEGVILRSPSGLYKYGRSTVKEGFLLKLKRFVDGEAVVLSVLERLRNTNKATINELGLTSRSSEKANKYGIGVAGALKVKCLESGVEFSIGTGFDSSQALSWWINKEKLVGRIVKFKYQACGVKTAPRFPVFLGWRDSWDL